MAEAIEPVLNNESVSEGNQQNHLNEGDDSALFNNTFDRTLSTSHSYLGDDLEVLRGRTLLDNGIYVNLPLWPPESTWLVLFPGQTLPVVERNIKAIGMLRQCVKKDRTFGVASMRSVNSVGTTAEIYEYSEDPTIHGLEEIRVKAKGRQRFKIIRIKNTPDTGIPIADVKILPEVVLGPPFYQERLASFDRLRVLPTNEKTARKHDRIIRQEAIITPWPAWVYHQYDSKRLSKKIHYYLKFLQSRGSNIPSDPTDLSFWVAQNLVITPKTALSLLEMDCVIQRLQREVKLLARLTNNFFICKRCRIKIAKQTDVLQMNEEGLQSAYCNAAGRVHETITLYKAQSLTLNREPPSTDYTWFPGYAWTIASCSNCGSHMGWKFTATRSDLKPSSFWGLTRMALLWSGRKSHYCDEWNTDEDDDNFPESEIVSESEYSNTFLI